MTRKKPPEPEPQPQCHVDGCGREPYTRGLCALHWCSRADLADPPPDPPQRVASAQPNTRA